MRIFSAATGLAALMMLGGAAQAQNLDALRQSLLQLQGSASDMENNLRLAVEPDHVYLGVKLADIDAGRAHALKLDEERGVEVVKVVPGSPAESAGLRAGDVLLSYNGENILGARQLGRLVSETPEGRKVRIQFWRDGKTQTTTATIAQAAVRRMAPQDFEFQMPEIDVQTLAIPDPLMVWKNMGLGIEAEPVDGQLAQYFGVKSGVLVRAVEKGSAADKAGLRAGDVLTAVSQKPVSNPHELISTLRIQRRTGKSMSLSVMREHKQITVNIAPEAQNQE